MLRKITLVLLAAIGIFFSADAQKINKYALRVGDFYKLKVNDNANVVYRCNPDSSGYAVFSGREEFADAFIFSNNGKGTLTVQVSTEDVGNPDLPVLYLYSDFLTYVENSSIMSVEVFDPAPAPKFNARLIGNGSIRVFGLKATEAEAKISTGCGSISMTGEAVKAKYVMIGTGAIRAEELKVQRVDCSIMGSGEIMCWPEDELRVKGLGSTKIYYRGNPNEIKKSGGGKLIRLGAEEK